MRTLVLGGGGFIGSHVVAHLSDQGDDVIAVDIDFPDIRREWWSRATTMHTDLLESRRWLSDAGGADRVFHFAADMGGVGYFHSPADPLAAMNNMRIDLNVLRVCQAEQIPLFYAASACAYPTATQRHDTDHVLYEWLLGGGPADQMYGEQKRFMTLLLAHEPRARVGVFHTIFGPGQDSEGRRAKFPPAICRKVKTGGTIDIWGDGTQTRTFLYIDDAVRKIMTVAGHDTYDGPVNIGSDDEVTVRQCADWLCDHAGISRDYRFQPDKPTGVAARACDNTEYDRRYGHHDGVSTRDGLIRLFEWLT